MTHKVYVEVIAEFSEEGPILQISIKWQDGTIYEIDRVLDIRSAASLKAGGIGIRIKGKETYLWYEEPK